MSANILTNSTTVNISNSGHMDDEQPETAAKNSLFTKSTPVAKRGGRRGRNPSKTSKVPAKPTKTKWSAADDAELVKTLLEQRALGLQSESGFKSAAYTACAVALAGSEKVSGGIAKDATACMNHFAKLKKDCGIVKKLREVSGFGWDDVEQKVTATDEVWDAYIAAHPPAAKWRNKGFPLYDDIMTIIDGIVATGELAFHAGQAPMADDVVPTEDEHVAGTDGDDENSDGVDDGDSDGEDELRNISRKRKHIASATPKVTKAKRIRPSTPRTSSAAIFQLTSQFGTIAKSFETPSNALSSPARRSAAISLLDDDDELSANEHVKAIQLFSRHTAVADSYVAIKKKPIRVAFIQAEIEREFLSTF